MRISEAALALISRVDSRGETAYLTQWNNGWQSYSLIGGYAEAGGAILECCVRELEEEVELPLEVEFQVEDKALSAMLEYVAISETAGVFSRYQVELFSTQLLTVKAMVNVDWTKTTTGWHPQRLFK
jgi:8-oxo-dGTP pyrophosphatase MutT (NUDIX family)